MQAKPINENTQSSYSNPYESTYNNLKFNISENTTRYEAEHVVRQVGYLFNTLTIAIKDMIKMLSFKFQDQNPHNQSKQPYPKDSKTSLGRNNETHSAKTFERAKNFRHPKEQNLNPKKSTVKISSEQKTYISNQINLEQSENEETDNGKNPIVSKIIKQLRCTKDKKLETVFEKMDVQKQDRSGFDLDQFTFNDMKQVQTEKQKLEINLEEQRNVISREDSSFKDFMAIRKEAGRKKKDREKMSGITCPDCKNFYEACGVNTGEKLCQCSSRHRSNHPATTPVNFSQQLSLD